jgi:hypothetical protein
MDIHDATVDEVEDEGTDAELVEAEADLEAPEADTVEQHQAVGPDHPRFAREHVPLDADEADVAEQSQIVEPYEDEYR